MATDGNQAELKLAWGVLRAPVDAPAKVLRQVESEAQALAVSIAAGHHKLEYVAACIGKSKSYVSRLRSGERAIPSRLVGPLCAATGSNLLRQFIDLQRAMGDCCQVARLAELLRAA
ncbi:hypothetical protein [Xanthomonas sacchari]|uniref:hypothetical protein n=1 Tax=Xanthomonas sacchari TaxID=56458 RepID=UPI00225BB856|nr:hypothetical protein [Xanthomonas sacchari]MCW0370248.1 hypothetical protein [Xanthomonas sacchari]